ncbi:MAG: glycosyltransferase family 39 protein [Pirellulaceae bacterium]|nr:glycosyltransferase family 39 protein [Pirellulaceae bacterium]
MRPTHLHIGVIVLTAGLVLFPNLGGPRLWDRDEPRNAGCAAEMLARGDWVVPVFNGELRAHKPVLLYWFMMAAYSVFGVNEFAARFWSAVLGVGTTLCTYVIGRRLFHPRVGLWAAVILATAIMFDVEGRAATPDSVLIFFSCLAVMLYVVSVFPDRAPGEVGEDARTEPRDGYIPSWPWCVAIYAVMGIGTLDKGPVALVLPTAVLGMFLLLVRPTVRDWSRHWIGRGAQLVGHFFRTCWSMRPITAIAAALLVALPWYVWVAIRTDGAWPRGFFLEHNLGRAMQPMEGHDGSTLFYYPITFLIGFMPWSVFLAPILIGLVARLRRNDPWKNGYIFAACWIGVYIGLFSLAQTKLPSYITPGYPGAALLAGCFFYRFARGEAAASAIWTRLAIACNIALGAAMAIGLPLAAREILPGEEWLGALAVIPLACGGFAWWSLSKRRPDRAAYGFLGGALLFVIAAFTLVTARVDKHQHFNRVIDVIERRSPEHELVWLGAMEPSWVFYAGAPIDRAVVVDAESDAELNWTSGHPAVAGPRRAAPSSEVGGVRSGSVWVVRPHHDAVQFLAGGPDRYVLSTRQQYEHVKDKLPSQYQVVVAAPYFLKDHEIVAIGWTDRAIANLRDGSLTR